MKREGKGEERHNNKGRDRKRERVIVNIECEK